MAPALRSALKGGTLLALGLLVGAFAAVAAVRPPAPPAVQQVTKPRVKATRLADSDSEVARLAAEQRDLARRLAAIEAVPSAGVPSMQGPPDVPIPEHLDPEARRLELRARHESYRKAHAEEPREHGWAEEQEREVSQTLRQNAMMGGVDALRIDCRTTLCRAEFEWPSYAEAQKTYSNALHVFLEGCDSAILLEPPEDPTLPYRATATYDCTEGRTAAAE
jgi:hypothetical protein